MTEPERPGAPERDSPEGQAALPAGMAPPGTHPQPQDVAALACEGFGMILELLGRCQERQDELFSACAFAAAAAADGRNILARAFPLALTVPVAVAVAVAVEHDGASTAAIACFVGLLADVLSAVLRAAARRPLPDAQRVACSAAADQAAQVCQLLAGDG